MMVENKETNLMTKMFLETLSPFDFGSTVELLSKEIENKSWKISNVYDLQKTLNQHGKDVLPVKVFSLCHPNHSSRILEKDSERIISSMMPCRVSIYEKADGKTYISRMNSSMIAAGFGGIAEQVMTESANEVEEIIEHILHAD
ncbi:MAG: DUF302 domain-containing protein [Bacteroidales bacterium]|jgi:uncharacterized protein (DUF302 family)|nr:DUF302 domain-containing protein [Bacteroidales bacterium]NLN37563.1 DUF302 domain-containing protein [Bacteroidales bacterium]